MFTIMKIEDLYELFLSTSEVSTDTRNISKDCMFFALKGDSFNGNQFAIEAINKGAKYAVIDEKEFESNNTILVDNVLETLQLLANYHRNQFKNPVIGITGTNGKTTSKELISSVLSQHFNIHFTKGNFNNHIGVPLTLLSLNLDCDLAIIEMGANHIGEIGFLCNIAEPDYGIITNIGTAHIEGFGSKEGVIKTKNEIYKYISKNGKLIFTNNDDQLLSKLSEDISKYTYGINNSDCVGKMISDTPNIKLEWNNCIINSTLYGSYNFYNILLAISIGEYFKVPNEKIIKGVETYVSENNRSQFIKTDNYDIYLDAYNANPSSMEVAINSFAANSDLNKIMILGDMLELGEISSDEHRNIIYLAKKLDIKTFFVGSEFKKSIENPDSNFCSNADDLISELKNNPLENCSILIKGSRGIKLEKVADFLK